MKRVVLVAMVVLAACGGGEGEKVDDAWTMVPGSSYSGTDVYYGEFTTPEGRVIPCLVWSGYNAGGMSCDWAER